VESTLTGSDLAEAGPSEPVKEEAKPEPVEEVKAEPAP